MDNLRELQLMELEILKEVITLFERNNIRYFALGGTMLGAVRHKGFIPWDDDIDIGVPREDYERLEAACKELPEHLKFHHCKNDADFIYYFSRVENASIQVHSDRAEKEEITSAWIDIFPLDGMPNSALARTIHSQRILIDRALFQISRFDRIVDLRKSNRPTFEKVVIRFARNASLQKLLDNNYTFRILDRTLRKHPYSKSNYNINAMGAYKLREMFNKRVFGDGAMYSFEDIQIRGPQDYEAYLTQLYGDWRTPADFSHHSVVAITKNTD